MRRERRSGMQLEIGFAYRVRLEYYCAMFSGVRARENARRVRGESCSLTAKAPWYSASSPRSSSPQGAKSIDVVSLRHEGIEVESGLLQ